MMEHRKGEKAIRNGIINKGEKQSRGDGRRDEETKKGQRGGWDHRDGGMQRKKPRAEKRKLKQGR